MMGIVGVLSLTGISVKSNNDRGSVDSHGLRESINSNKLCLLSEERVGALECEPA